MFSAIASIIASLIEKIGLAWWQKKEKQEADNVPNQVNKMSDTAVAEQLRDQWTKPN